MSNPGPRKWQSSITVHIVAQCVVVNERGIRVGDLARSLGITRNRLIQLINGSNSSLSCHGGIVSGLTKESAAALIGAWSITTKGRRMAADMLSRALLGNGAAEVEDRGKTPQ